MTECTPKTHTLRVDLFHDDGFTTVSEREQPGDAREAHDALAERWKRAGWKFDRDQDQLQLSRDVDRGDGLTWREAVQHIEVDA